MFHRRFLVLASLSLVSLGSHAGLFGSPEGLKEACFQKHSHAWCTLDAAGLSRSVEDMSKQEYDKSVAGKNPIASGVIDAAGIAATASHAWRPAPGFSRGGEIGMLLLSSLVRASPLNIGTNGVIAWMPKQMAATPFDAKMKMYEMTVAATLQTFSGYQLTERVVPTPVNMKAYSASPVLHRGYDIHGGDCDTSKCVLDIPDFLPYSPTEGKAPEWLGGYDAWVFGRGSGQAAAQLSINGIYVSQTYARALSQNLPKWAYLVILPQSDIPVYGVINAGQAVPLIFNDGRANAIVFPEVEVDPPGQ